MTEYAIKAYPTEYRGRTYRSRLEARWAAFFDLLGWKHEYEPFDLGKWSPDFFLPEMRALVEIKPITGICKDTCDKMLGACSERGLIPARPPYANEIVSLVLLGVSPIATGDRGALKIGWFAMNFDAFEVWERAYLSWVPNCYSPVFKPEIISSSPDGWHAASGSDGDWNQECRPLSYQNHTIELWARATGLVQWRPE